MRNETKLYLKKYWFRFAFMLFGMILMICGDIGEDPRQALFIGGVAIALCGATLIDSARISDLDERIESLEKKSDESF